MHRYMYLYDGGRRRTYKYYALWSRVDTNSQSLASAILIIRRAITLTSKTKKFNRIFYT